MLFFFQNFKQMVSVILLISGSILIWEIVCKRVSLIAQVIWNVPTLWCPAGNDFGASSVFSSRSDVYNLVAREARVYHTSIARPAWFPLGYKSIEFGCCPPWRRPVSDVRAHYGFPGNRLPSTSKLWVLFMKTVFFHLWIITMFTVGKSPNISGK